MPVRRTRSKVSSDSSNTPPFIPSTEGELHELVAARAYEIYLQRATGPGDEVADWLAAEKDVKATIDSLSTVSISPPLRKVEEPAVQKSRATRTPSAPGRRKTPLQNRPA